MRNLLGEYRHKLDAKGRLSLPANFRKGLPEVLTVTLSPTDDYLMVFDVDGFGAWVESLFEKDGGYSASNARHVAARKKLNSRARPVEPDGSYRIGLAADLREKAGLDKEVVLVGNGDNFEIWDAARWDAFVGDVDLAELFV